MHDIFVMQRLNEIAIFYRQNFIPLSFWFVYFFLKKTALIQHPGYQQRCVF